MEGTPQEFAASSAAMPWRRSRSRARSRSRCGARNLLSAPLGLLRDILREVRISLKLREELEVLLVLAREAGVSCTLFLDEFPTILELREGAKALGEGIVRKLRTKYERMEGLVLSISGSVWP